MVNEELKSLKRVSKNIIDILINNIGLKKYQKKILYDRYINKKLIKNIAIEYNKSERKINSDLKNARNRMFYLIEKEYNIQDDLTKKAINILLNNDKEA